MSLWKIKIPRGKKENLPTLSLGEIAFVTDEKELYVGGSDGENINITNNTQLKELKNNIKSDQKYVNVSLSASTINTNGYIIPSSVVANDYFSLNGDGLLQCNKAGKYRFYFKIYFATLPIGKYILSYRKNDNDVASEVTNVATSSSAITTRVLAYNTCLVNDVIGCYLEQTSGSTVTNSTDARFSQLYIERIGD